MMRSLTVPNPIVKQVRHAWAVLVMPMTILAHDVIRIKFAIAKFVMQPMNLVPNVRMRKCVSKAVVSIPMSRVIRLVNRRNSV